MKNHTKRVIAYSALSTIIFSCFSVPGAHALEDPLKLPNKSNTTYLLEPSDDGTVRTGSYSNEVFGTSRDLAILNSSNIDDSREIFVKYSPKSIPGTIKNGTIELQPQLGGEPWGDYSGGNFAVSRADTNWKESTLTYKNKPKLLKELGEGNAVLGGSNHSIPLDASMIADLNAGKDISIAVTQKYSAFWVTHKSKEYGSPIRLKLNIDKQMTSEHKAIAWNSHQPGQAVGVNHKNETTLTVQGYPEARWATTSYLTFDIAKIDMTKAQKLNFYLNTKNWANTNPTFGVYAVKEKTDVRTLTRDSVMTLGNKVGTYKGVKGEWQWVQTDISKEIQAARLRNEKTLTFAIRADTPDTGGSIIPNSHETGNFRYPYIQTKNTVNVALPAQKTQVSAKPKTTTSNKTTSSNKQYYFTSMKAAVKSSKSSKSKTLVTIPSGKQITYLSKSGSWSKVKYAGKTGWVPSSAVETRNKKTTVVTTTTKFAGSAVNTYFVNTLSALKQSKPSVAGVYNTSRDLSQIKSGTGATYLNSASVWTQIKVGATTGYVYNWQVTKKTDYKVETKMSSKTSSMWVYTSKNKVSAYNGTTKGKKYVMSIPKNKQVQHLYSNGSWKKVSYNGKSGWVAGASLK